MYKEVIRTGIIGAVLAIAATGCGSKDNGAQSLLDQAQAAFDNGNYKESLVLIDSLAKAFPEEISIQRAAMHLRPMADEQLTMLEIEHNDSAMAAAKSEVERLKGNFVFVKEKDMVEGYTIHKEAKKHPLINRTGLEARIDERYNLYVVSLLNGRSVNHERISISGAGGEVSTATVAYDGASNYRFNSGGVSNESVTFRGGKSDTLCMYVAEHKGNALKLNFIGKNRYSVPLSATDKKAVAETQEYAVALQNNREAELRNAYLENRLKISREHIEKTAQKAQQ